MFVIQRFMQKLFIQKFGPLKNLEVPVDKDLILLIGRQAVGKSTLCELIFFFKSIREEVLDLLYYDLEGDIEPMSMLLKRIRSRFTPEMFGPTLHMGDFAVKYQYGSGKFIEIRQDTEGELSGCRVIFSDRAGFQDGVLAERNSFFTAMQRLLQGILAFRRDYGTESSIFSPRDRREREQEKQRIRQDLENQIDLLFEDHREVMYIPASRSMMTSLSESFIGTDADRFRHPKYVVNHFLKTIQDIRPFLRQSLSEMIEARILDGEENVLKRRRVASEAQRLIEKGILKGKYRFRGFDEVLQIGEDQYVKMAFASSGQQESLWISLVIFMLILHAHQNDVFLVIEEPEAHLYPVAQKAVSELIGLLLNINPGRNQVMVTTHSPYILASINNLIYASHVGERVPESEREITADFWIDSSRVDAFSMEATDEAGQTVLESLKDEDPDQPLLRTEAIDNQASGMILSTFDHISLYETREAAET